MGGSITVASRPGEGSCFTVELSLSLLEEIAAPPQVANTDAISCPSVPRVLYVGRHAAERQLLRLSLAAWQIVPDYADNLQEAVALCRHDHVVLMIVDAAELTSQSMKELQTLKNELPFCCLLGEHEFTDLLTAPLFGYLKKPVSQSALRRILDPLLVKSKPASSAVVGERI
jgi:DNA-binding NtrC family response regulator